ncbi:hypothetical protein ACO0LL_12030, partial [Undibacterium sp. TC4M20W]|uniref:hypothetical protein n=1 Tax=Undibacterium sp. TC4M20W TaxID=3413052 RepID=UPI003BF2202E
GATATAAVKARSVAARNAEKRVFIEVLPFNKIRLVLLTAVFMYYLVCLLPGTYLLRIDLNHLLLHFLG